jgi:murein DD-endopeptidase MepM/ murein hydrolase activator NlpD
MDKQRFTLPGIMLALALVLAAPQGGWAHGQAQIDKNRKENKQLFQRIRELNSQQKELSKSLQQLDGRIGAKEDEVASIKAELDAAEKRQVTMVAERQAAMEQLEIYQEQLAKRARQIYMQGDLTYAELLLQATSVEDFVDRMFFVQVVLEQDTALISNSRSTRDKLTELLAAVEQQIESIAQIKTKLDSELMALEGIKRDKQLDQQAMENDEALYLREIRENEQENKRIQEQIRAISRAGTGYKGEWKGKFHKPCPGPITSGFGYRNHPIFKRRKFHAGVDIGAPLGTPVHPGGKGKVIATGVMGGYGNAVVVDHGGGRTTLYGHLSKITCSAGDEVDTSDVIGKVGSTGNSTGNHLHFEVRINGTAVDPLGSL